MEISRASKIHSAAPKSRLQVPEQGQRGVVSSALGSQSVWSKKMQGKEPGAKSLCSLDSVSKGPGEGVAGSEYQTEVIRHSKPESWLAGY